MNEKLRSYEVVKLKTECFVESFKQAEKNQSLIAEINSKLHLCLSNSSRKIRIKQINNSFECEIDINCAPIDSLKELSINQLKGFLEVKTLHMSMIQRKSLSK